MTDEVFEIDAYKSVGPLRFGMSTVAVSSTLGEEPRKYTKSAASSAPTFAFRESSVHVYFDSTGLCEAIELFSPTNPLLQGMALIGEPYSTVRTWFEQRDHELIHTDAGFISKAFGVGVYAPAARKEPSEPIESVIVFAKGYYDNVGSSEER